MHASALKVDEESLDIPSKGEKLTALVLSYIQKTRYGQCHRDNTIPREKGEKSALGGSSIRSTVNPL